MTANRRRRLVYYICIFAMLGSLMFCSKLIMEVLPNIHLLGMLTMVYTLVFRWRALVPIYIYVFLNGLYAGFSPWWFPYLYIWTVLWGVTMLLPRKMPPRVGRIVYVAVCALHGLLFGVLYAPAEAIMYGMTFEETLIWLSAGVIFDVTHMIGDLVAGLLIVPLSQLLFKLNRRYE